MITCRKISKGICLRPLAVKATGCEDNFGRRPLVIKRIFILLFFLNLIATPILSQTSAIYWGLDWSMTEIQVDSSLQSVIKEKKIATKTNYSDNRQLSGHSYRIDEMGISKVYIWYNVKDQKKMSIHSIEVIYSFEYPYDAQRFTQAYFEKYGHAFEENAEIYQAKDGGSVLLRLIKEPTPGVLGRSIYQISMFSLIPFEMTKEDMEFLF